MYGYIVPDKTELRASDFVLYRSFYCGICCVTGKNYGQIPRLTTNYDFAFLSALLHDAAKSDVVIEEHKCILNPIKKKATVMPNPMLEKLAAANIILAYKKADDGVADGDGIKYRVVRRMLKKPFTKAKKLFPDIAAIIESGCDAQDAIEKAKVSGIDRAADAFANTLRELAVEISGIETDDNLKSLCYNIGKFVYVCDAIDDLADDLKKKRYNPYIAAYGLNRKTFEGRKEFLTAHEQDLRFTLEACAGRAAQSLSAMRLTQCFGLLRNIVCVGMRKKIEELLMSHKKLPPPRI